MSAEEPPAPGSTKAPAAVTTTAAARIRRPWTFGSGPDVGWTFHRALALVFLVAWVSLGSQVRLLVGARGLLPLADLVEAARAQDALGFGSFPSWLVAWPRDGVLVGGTIIGALLSIVALAGIAPRACAAVQTFLYLGYAVACRGFLGFQWDNMLLEAGALAAFLPSDRAAPVVHALFRALVFKLYFESGLAKWQSPVGDWRDGSAMTFYYQTAPLPTVLGWYGHHLPAWWHHLESRATLVLELGVAFAIFGPRRARLFAAIAFTVFQVVDLATANYGFFCYLAIVLHLFLLDDRDVRGLRARLERRLPAWWLRLARWRARLPDRTWLRRTRAGLGIGGASAWLAVSLTEAAFMFTGADPTRAAWRPLVALVELEQPFRLVNTYHLFASVTRERIEPEFQAQVATGDWQPLDLRHKPGAVARAPDFVAPHQPRVDFLLWFYGLAHDRRVPAYVSELLARLCEDRPAVAPLFAAPLPDDVRAVRIVFWEYGFTSPAERRASSAWWSRRAVGLTKPMPCSAAP